MRSWAAAIIIVCGCLAIFVSAAKQQIQYRELDNVIVLTGGGDLGDTEHMFKYEGDDDVKDQFFGRICDEDGLKPGMILNKITFRMDYFRSCWDKSYPGGVKYRRDHEHHVVYAFTEQAQR